MQLLKWFCSKYCLIPFFLTLILSCTLIQTSAQFSIIEHQVAEKETLYKISMLYNTKIDLNLCVCKKFIQCSFRKSLNLKIGIWKIDLPTKLITI